MEPQISLIILIVITEKGKLEFLNSMHSFKI